MRRPIDTADELSQAMLFALLKKLHLMPVDESGLEWHLFELVSKKGDPHPHARAPVTVAIGIGDTPLHALSDMAINIAADDPLGELDTGVEPDAEEGETDGSDTD